MYELRTQLELKEIGATDANTSWFDKTCISSIVIPSSFEWELLPRLETPVSTKVIPDVDSNVQGPTSISVLN